MHFKYPHLSSGYVDHRKSGQTLNSKFYSDFESKCNSGLIKLDGEIILFPQRIPRADFFVELYKVESNDFKVAFERKTLHINERLRLMAKYRSPNLRMEDIRSYINYANLCLRYGCFDMVKETSAFGTPDMPYALEVALLHEAAIIEHNLSHNLSVTIDNYLALANQYLANDSVTDREKIMLLNNLIVTYYRHQKAKEKNSLIFDYANQLLRLLERFVDNTAISQLYCSVGYRGLAMVKEFGRSTQSSFLQKAETLALLMPTENTSDTIVSLENLYTCTQSIAKWCEMTGEPDRAEYHLKKMIEIDEYDSTGYSELGFFYLNQHRHENAADYFKQALELGPPGAGMNSYYYAKCLEQMGDYDMAIGYLLKATRLDDKAASPYVDLFEIYKRKNDSINAYVISQIVQNTPDLWEQLEDNEKKFLQSYAH